MDLVHLWFRVIKLQAQFQPLVQFQFLFNILVTLQKFLTGIDATLFRFSCQLTWLPSLGHLLPPQHFRNIVCWISTNIQSSCYFLHSNMPTFLPKCLHCSYVFVCHYVVRLIWSQGILWRSCVAFKLLVHSSTSSKDMHELLILRWISTGLTPSLLRNTPQIAPLMCVLTIWRASLHWRCLLVLLYSNAPLPVGNSSNYKDYSCELPYRVFLRFSHE